MVVSAISLFSGYCNFLQQASLARGDQYSLARSLNGRHALKLKKRDLRKSIFVYSFYAQRKMVCNSGPSVLCQNIFFEDIKVHVIMAYISLNCSTHEEFLFFSLSLVLV